MVIGLSSHPRGSRHPRATRPYLSAQISSCVCVYRVHLFSSELETDWINASILIKIKSHCKGLRNFYNPLLTPHRAGYSYLRRLTVQCLRRFAASELVGGGDLAGTVWRWRGGGGCGLVCVRASRVMFWGRGYSQSELPVALLQKHVCHRPTASATASAISRITMDEKKSTSCEAATIEVERHKTVVDAAAQKCVCPILLSSSARRSCQRSRWAGRCV